MKQIILHIPHSSAVIPIMDGFLVSLKNLEDEQNLLTDWHTDNLFSHVNAIQIVAGFSRIFCDVERFACDDLEVMSKVGMGVLYETKDDGTPLRKITPELRFRIINEFYYEHHRRLTNAVDAQLEQ
jgi:N-formylglutamate deformylase